jgi:uncharacterized protein
MSFLAPRYFALTTEHPALTLAAVALLVLGLALGVPKFELDASPESLMLEDDRDLQYFRSISARYGSDAFLVVAYTPHGDLFAPRTLRSIERLSDELAALEPVASVTSLLDVPLLESPPVTLAELQEGMRTLLSPDTDMALARKELAQSPLYGNLLVGEAGRTTALYLRLKQDPERQALVRERDALLEVRLERSLRPEEQARLNALSEAVRDRDAVLADQLQQHIARIRGIARTYESEARIHLAGGPLIISDMIGFIRHDLRVFGLAVALFILVLLALAFRRPRWVIIPAAICAGAGVGMVGFLGWTGWRPTVVSSNFLPVLLVVTLSLVVHLVVRYRELHERDPAARQGELVAETIRSKFAPSSYTALTTMVAFGSLALSGIRPVIDFGWMMVLGIAFSFVLAFLVFPASLMLLAPGAPPSRRYDPSGALTRFFARLVEGRNAATLLASAAVFALGVAGMARLGVENRFIDYFDESTEIYQGMIALDRELGGTTPFEVILDPDAQSRAERGQGGGDAKRLAGGAGFAAESYWFNVSGLETLTNVHSYLENLPDTGKVLSLATAAQLLKQINEGRPLDNFTLSLVHARLPDAVREVMIDPYLSGDGSQARLSVRVFESDPGLERNALLGKIRSDLNERFGLEPEQVRLTGLMVLYNNVLQSLFRSQALTAGFVFAAVMLMFVLLFRSLRIAALALVPNVLVAVAVLGAMGWLGISLDIMTITIAAIVLGIAVDDTIHYTHRYLEEFARERDYRAAMRRSHASVGRAMLYTSITIALGFSLFALSAFVPIAYFGLLTGLAMLAALVADLTLLAVLYAAFKPLGPGHHQ